MDSKAGFVGYRVLDGDLRDSRENTQLVRGVTDSTAGREDSPSRIRGLFS